MNFDITLEGRTTLAVNYETATSELGYPAAVAGAALKKAAVKVVGEFANGYRGKLASSDAGKLAEYRIKEEIARDPSSASPEELALLDREAAASGMDRAALLAIIAAKAAAYRQVALLIGVLEAEAGAVIAALPSSAADIETQIEAMLTATKAQAETAFTDALALIGAT